MMQNTSIIYHPESLLEMQIICWCVIKFYFGVEEANNHTDISNIIMWALIVEHLFSYSSGVFRQWEIRKNGMLDRDGILRGKYESIMKSVNIFFDCVLVGYALKHFM